MKKLIFNLGILISLALVFSLSLVSAGLCKGSDGYYHDCNDFSYRYYKNNFYPNYKTEYYKETSSSSSSILSIKEDQWDYEKISASSSAQTEIEGYRVERDYSYPKTRYDSYGRENYNPYEWDDEPHLIMFVNKADPIHYKNREALNNINRDSSCSSSSCSDWRNKEPYKTGSYDDTQYDDYYYKPRYDNYNQEFNWGW